MSLTARGDTSSPARADGPSAARAVPSTMAIMARRRGVRGWVICMVSNPAGTVGTTMRGEAPAPGHRLCHYIDAHSAKSRRMISFFARPVNGEFAPDSGRGAFWLAATMQRIRLNGEGIALNVKEYVARCRFCGFVASQRLHPLLGLCNAIRFLCKQA